MVVNRLIFNAIGGFCVASSLDFNPGTPLIQRRTPIHPYTAIQCVSYQSAEEVDLNDINHNRLDANGDPLPTGCYGGISENCKEFRGWENDY